MFQQVISTLKKVTLGDELLQSPKNSPRSSPRSSPKLPKRQPTDQGRISPLVEQITDGGISPTTSTSPVTEPCDSQQPTR